MSVYTSVNIEELKDWLKDYVLDDLTDYQGIKSGITNTNYFLMTKLFQMRIETFGYLGHLLDLQLSYLPWLLKPKATTCVSFVL